MQEGSKLTIPLAIIVAGVLIAGAVFFVNRDGGGQVTQEEVIQEEEVAEPRAVTLDDHILGNPNADIFIIEYSDT